MPRFEETKRHADASVCLRDDQDADRIEGDLRACDRPSATDSSPI